MDFGSPPFPLYEQLDTAHALFSYHIFLTDCLTMLIAYLENSVE